MSSEVQVPTLGESVTEATIGQWLKQPGEAVALDEPIASLETDKVAVEVMAPAAGVMGQHLAAEGDNVAVGAVIATIEDSTAVAGAAPVTPRAEKAVPPASDTLPKNAANKVLRRLLRDAAAKARQGEGEVEFHAVGKRG